MSDAEFAILTFLGWLRLKPLLCGALLRGDVGAIDVLTEYQEAMKAAADSSHSSAGRTPGDKARDAESALRDAVGPRVLPAKGP